MVILPVRLQLFLNMTPAVLQIISQFEFGLFEEEESFAAHQCKAEKVSYY